MNPTPPKPLSKRFIAILALGAIVTVASPFLILYIDLALHEKQVNFFDLIRILQSSKI